jgi:hypothetical protein
MHEEQQTCCTAELRWQILKYTLAVIAILAFIPVLF